MLENPFYDIAIFAFALGLLLFLVTAALVVLVAAIAWWEKRYVQCLRPLDDNEERPEIPPYIQGVNAMAAQLEFVWEGFFVRTPEGMLRTIWSVFRSPDRAILVIAGYSTVGFIRQKGTLVFSKMINDKYLITTDETGEHDISGRTERQLQMNAAFPELLECHQARLDATGGPAGSFGAESVLKDLERLALEQAEALEQRDYAVFLDADRTVWRYTLKGAVVLATIGFGKQLWQAFAQGRTPKSNI